jgi:hypothetical protein
MSIAGAANVLLVKSVEESAPELVDSEAILDAELEAGSLKDPAEWFSRRAGRIVSSLPPAVQTLPTMTNALSGGLGKLLAAAALLGVLTNYLGPSQKIHVVYNPIVLLVLWNLGVYVLLVGGWLGLGRLRARGGEAARTAKREPGDAVEAGASAAVGRATPPGRLARRVFGWSVPALWARLHRAAAETREEGKRLSRVAKEFWSQWADVAQPLFGAAARRALHVGAIGLAAGAVLGMFVRGLFLDYHIVWRSTFVTDPQTVGHILGLLFGLPALVASQPLPTPQATAALLGPEGVPARQWIWIYASAALLFIGIPRLVLVAAATRRFRSLGACLDLSLDGDYYAQILSRAREHRVDQIESAIRTDVRIETGKFAEGIATYVCARLYDARIVTRLRRFREAGGRIRELEDDIAAECGDFQAELDAYFPRAQAQFSDSLQRAVASSVAADVQFDASASDGLKDEVGGTSRGSTAGIGESMGRGIHRAVGSAISGAVALAVGTLSGGFGKSLGVAVVATLLGTTGPVGFLIGALAGLVAAGGAYLLGQKRATAAIKSIRLPAPVSRALLWPGRLDRLIARGRTQCHDAVEGLVKEKLEPLTPRISDEIWRQVKPVIAERHRGGQALGRG